MAAMRQMLEDNGLGQDKTGRMFFDQLITAFQMGGYPLNKRDEYRALDGKPADNPLIRSGKYVRLINVKSANFGTNFFKSVP